MESEIQIFFNNIRLIGPKLVDIESGSKQVRVPVNAQMFQKSNHKGMAIILYPLLCFFDEPFFRPMFDTCWFPYGLAEMKQFKQVCLDIALILEKRGIFP